jgi:hypothetical protein
MLLSSTPCGMAAAQCVFCFTFFNCACIAPQREALSSKEAGPNFDVVIASSAARLRIKILYGKAEMLARLEFPEETIEIYGDAVRVFQRAGNWCAC